MTLEAISLDLDGTLVDTSAAESLAMEKIAARYGLTAGEFGPIYSSVARRVWAHAMSTPTTDWDGRPALARIWTEALVLFGVDICGQEDEVAEAFLEEAREHYRLYPDAEAVLPALAERFPLAVVSNGPAHEQRTKLDRLGITEYFAAVCISGELGVGKPDPEIFRKAAAALGVAPSRMLHAGDRIASDIEGARAAGAVSVWINRSGMAPEGETPECQLPTLEQLPELADRLAHEGAKPGRG